MKRKFFIPLLLIPLGAFLIFAGYMLVHKINDILIFAALSECDLPREKKFEIEKMKIGGCKGVVDHATDEEIVEVEIE